YSLDHCTHAAADIEQQDEIERLQIGREAGDVLLLAVVEDAEVWFGEAGDDAAVAVGYFGVDVDERDVGVEGGRGLRVGGLPHRCLQDGDHIGITTLGGEAQGGVAAGVAGVHIGAGGDQQLCDRGRIHDVVFVVELFRAVDRLHQRGPAALRPGVDIRAELQQHLRAVGLVLSSGQNQRRFAA